MPTWTCNGKFPGSPLSYEEKRKHLYHFTSFDTFVKIWLSKELLFADVRKVNDLLEYKISWNFANFLQAPVMFAIDEARYNYKQISLTMDYDSYLKGCMSSIMWGYYADKTKGVCIELDFDKLDLSSCLYSNINYTPKTSASIDVPANIRTRNEVEQWILENQQRFFFTKQDTWQGENEFRIISNSKTSIDISNAIVAVYITDAESDTCRFVSALVGEKVPVFVVSFKDTGTKVNIPRCSDAIETRGLLLKARTNPKNYLNTIKVQAQEYYESHKDDWDYPLLFEHLPPSD